MTVDDVPSVKEPYPYADTRAAMMLRNALDRQGRERNLSMRALAKQLGYKQATVLSHMANGRVAIPLERASEIARAVALPASEFLAAAVAQRAPEAAELLTIDPYASAERDATHSTGFITELTGFAGVPPEALNSEQMQVMREVALDPRPLRRWLTAAELPVMVQLRRIRPNISAESLSTRELAAIEAALKGPG